MVTDPGMPPLEGGVSLAFATLVARFTVPEAVELNRGLAQSILEREASAPSHDHANIGGWHSSSTFLDWPGPEVGRLRSWITEGLNRLVQATYQLPEVQSRPTQPRGGFFVTAWANVARRGHYHRVHNHPGSAWSGCYYVAAPEPAESLAGVLEFYDPRPFVEMTDVPGTPYGQRLLIRPTPGLLVFFPGWLYHFVHPCSSDQPRISIAFNATWRPS